MSETIDPSTRIHVTPWVEYTESAHHYRIRALYGLEVIGTQDPHITVTAEIESRSGSRGRWHEDSAGCLHTEVARRFPYLAPLIPYHLCSIRPDGTIEPMHYVANAIYWAEYVAGVSRWTPETYDPDPLNALKNTVLLGAVPGDSLPDFVQAAAPLTENEPLEQRRRRLAVAIATWCAARQSALTESAYAVLKSLNLMPESGGAL